MSFPKEKFKNKQDKANLIQKILNKYYPTPPIPLKHKDNFTLLIAVLLSAQCTDKRVNSITPKLFEKADTPEKMCLLSPEEIRHIIKPCGLSSQKSKAIYQLSFILKSQYNSRVPSDLKSLELLPGVGHKTASVVMNQAFGVPSFPVDTHIHRLSYRWGLSKGKNVRQTEKDLKKLFPKEKWGILHLQMIYFGREYCSARSHNPYNCPICSICGRKSLFI